MSSLSTNELKTVDGTKSVQVADIVYSPDGGVIEGSNGIVKLPDGTMMQYGSNSGVSTGSDFTNFYGNTSGTVARARKDITFYEPFLSGTVPIVTATPEWIDTDQDKNSVGCFILEDATTNEMVRIDVAYTSSTASFNWIAIGRWK